MDATVLRFTTKLFDVTKERPNDINPIYGESLLLWLADKLKGQVAVPEPQTEDWGWYAILIGRGAGTCWAPARQTKRMANVSGSFRS
jgi:hypothetical protein